MAQLHAAFTSSQALCLAPGGLLRSGVLADSGAAFVRLGREILGRQIHAH